MKLTTYCRTIALNSGLLLGSGCQHCSIRALTPFGNGKFRGRTGLILCSYANNEGQHGIANSLLGTHLFLRALRMYSPLRMVPCV